MKGKPTLRDFETAKPAELQKTYKLDQRGLENAQRKVMYGYTRNDLKKGYDQFYRRNRRDE